MKYTYKSPLEQGYIKIKLSKEEHERIFESRDIAFKYAYYESKYDFMYETYIKWWLKIIIVILYPIRLLIDGIKEFHEINKDISNLFHEKERGHFYSEHQFKDILRKKNIEFTDHFKDKVIK